MQRDGWSQENQTKKKAKRGKTAKEREENAARLTNAAEKQSAMRQRRDDTIIKVRKVGTNKDEEQQIEAQLAVAAELLRNGASHKDGAGEIS